MQKNRNTLARFRLLITACLLVPAILLSSGCSLFSNTKPVDKDDHTLSVVFGHFDMKDAPSWGGIDWVSVKQYKPEVNHYSAGVEDGLFWHIGVSQGAAIQVEQFGRNTRWYSNATYTYNFGGKGKNDTARVIKKPGVYFLGAYKYKNIDSGSFFKPDSFDMIPANAPTEKELLTKLLGIMKKSRSLSGYPHQIGLIQKRLAQLD